MVPLRSWRLAVIAFVVASSCACVKVDAKRMERKPRPKAKSVFRGTELEEKEPPATEPPAKETDKAALKGRYYIHDFKGKGSSMSSSSKGKSSSTTASISSSSGKGKGKGKGKVEKDHFVLEEDCVPLTPAPVAKDKGKRKGKRDRKRKGKRHLGKRKMERNKKPNTRGKKKKRPSEKEEYDEKESNNKKESKNRPVYDESESFSMSKSKKKSKKNSKYYYSPSPTVFCKDSPTPAPSPVPTNAPTAIPTAQVTLPDEALSFVLVDADTNMDIAELITGGIINRVNAFEFGTTNVNVRVESNLPGLDIASVEFNNGQTDSFSPFAYCGDTAGNYNACDDLIGRIRSVAGVVTSTSGLTFPAVFAIIVVDVEGPTTVAATSTTDSTTPATSSSIFGSSSTLGTSSSSFFGSTSSTSFFTTSATSTAIP